MEKVADEIVKSFEAQMGAAMENLERGEMAFDDLNGGWVGGWLGMGTLCFTLTSFDSKFEPQIQTANLCEWAMLVNQLPVTTSDRAGSVVHAGAVLLLHPPL